MPASYFSKDWRRCLTAIFTTGKSRAPQRRPLCRERGFFCSLRRLASPPSVRDHEHQGHVGSRRQATLGRPSRAPCRHHPRARVERTKILLRFVAFCEPQARRARDQQALYWCANRKARWPPHRAAPCGEADRYYREIATKSCRQTPTKGLRGRVELALQQYPWPRRLSDFLG